MELSDLQERLHESSTASPAAASDDGRLCGRCGKRISLVASAMPCRCSGVYCDAHRAPEDHSCSVAQTSSLDLGTLHRDRQARDLVSSPSRRDVALPRVTMELSDYSRCFNLEHDMESRVAHVVAFLALAVILVISFFHLLGFSWSAVESATIWLAVGPVCAVSIAKFGPRLSTRGHPLCSSCIFSTRTWWFGGPSFRQMREVEYESAMEVLIYCCSYRKTNCLTDTLYSGPRELRFIWQTVLAKLTSLNRSGNGSNIFTGC